MKKSVSIARGLHPLGLVLLRPGLVTSVLAVVAFLGLAVVSNAFAQDADIKDVLDNLNRLERDVQTLNRQVYKGSLPPSSPKGSKTATGGRPLTGSNAYVNRINDRLDQLEEEIRNSTSNIENVTHTLSQISTRLDKLVSDIDYRLTNLEARSGGRPVGSLQGRAQQPAGPPKLSAAPRVGGVQREGPETGGPVVSSGKGKILGSVSETELSSVRSQSAAKAGADATASPDQAAAQPPKPKSMLPEGTPKDQYRFAYSFLRKNDYENAEKALKEFIGRYSDQPIAANAIYWLGRTYYVKGDYRSAADTFLRGYRKDPKGQKAPDILLRLGMSLNGLKKVKEACATYNKLAQDYPNASASTKKLLTMEKGRTGCK